MHFSDHFSSFYFDPISNGITEGGGEDEKPGGRMYTVTISLKQI